MKKKVFIFAMAAALCCCGSEETREDESRVMVEPTQVTMTFSPYTMEGMNDEGTGESGNTTRAAASIAGVVTKLDVWIIDGDGERTTISQMSTDDGFGTVTATIDKSKTYTVYAVGHNSDLAILNANGYLSFVNDNIKETLFYSTDITPASASTLSCVMERIVGRLRIETTDNVPVGADYITLTVANAATSWNVATGTPSNLADNRVIRINGVGTRVGQTVALTCHLISTSDAATNYDIVLTLYDSSDHALMQRTFNAVPIRNGYKTTYRGQLFSGELTASFMVNDWSEFDTVNF